MTTRHDELSLAAQKRIIERLNRIDEKIQRLLDNNDDLKDGKQQT